MDLNRLILTNNPCYKAGRTIAPKGIMVHSTGSNNPNLKRYVGPDDGRLGYNSNGNHWNRDSVRVCVHAFIGLDKDGVVCTYQTLPWNYRAWHAGDDANNTHISFEICEDNLQDYAYFWNVYGEAVELCAYLCAMYKLDPLQDIICHSEGAEMGIASNHADVMHWFPKHGASMDGFRADVRRRMEEDEMTEEQIRIIVRNEIELIKIEDADKPVSDWAKSSVEEAVAKGITDGTRPQSATTRQEVLTLIARNEAVRRDVDEENYNV